MYKNELFQLVSKSQTPSPVVLCTIWAITVNFADFGIGLICTAAYARANLISGSLCYSSWSFYRLYSGVTMSNFLFSNSVYTQFPNCHIYPLKYYNAQLQPLQTVYLNPIELGLWKVCWQRHCQWLNIWKTEKHQMYNPSRRSSLSLTGWPQKIVDWLQSLFLAAGMT